jgi:hypothetical protein
MNLEDKDGHEHAKEFLTSDFKFKILHCVDTPYGYDSILSPRP